MSPTEPTAAENAEIVREFHRRVLTEKDFDAVPALVASDYVEHNPALPGGVLRGRETLVEFWEKLFAAFPNLEVTEADVLASGDTVVTRHTGRGTHEASFMDLEPTDETFEIQGIDVYDLENGRIVESWISLDMLGLLQQLGAMPEEGSL